MGLGFRGIELLQCHPEVPHPDSPIYSLTEDHPAMGIKRFEV